MELQALRYAAMVSTMTFEQLVNTFARYRSKADPDITAARSKIMEFLKWTEIDEEQFAQDTNIILAAADFSKELTTAVMWLVEHGIGVRCVRLKPWRMEDGTLLLDVQQLIPLPQAADFQTRIGLKKQAERQGRMERHDLRENFWKSLLDHLKTKTDVFANISPATDNWIQAGIGRGGFSFIYRARQTSSQVELWIANNKAAFEALEAQKIEIETDFGGQLDWQESPESEGSRVRYVVEGGYRSPVEMQPAIHAGLADALVRLDKALRARVLALKL